MNKILSWLLVALLGAQANLALAADTKLTALTATTTYTGTDLLYIVLDPAGTPLSRKITIANLFTSPTFTTSITAPLLIGGTTSGGNLTLRSTAHATKGKILFSATSAYDEVNDRLGIGTASPAVPFELVGAGGWRFRAGASDGFTISQYNTNSWQFAGLSAGSNLKFANTNIIIGPGFQEFTEMTAPVAGAANSVRLYAEDNGSGKTRLMAIFASGVAQQVAIEP